MNVAAARVELHEQTLEQLRVGNHADAARGIRRLMMLLPPQHEARRVLLDVLDYAERQS